ncbi:MAG TPA: contact-dependent growth inhibition system immunity protein [Pyrinomonadaceae bacterium]|nr:contact-dependent growth inhibition system immunity protein [Pyrinomonadaceae bacterium]
MSNYRFKFPELYQFFGGYFYQGWSADYRWESAKPNFAAVVRHFKAVNPPATINRVRVELEDLLSNALEEAELSSALTELGSNFYPPAEQLSSSEWLKKILEILDESPTKSRVLRELR